MNRRERISAVLHRRPADRLCWTVLADQVTQSRMPPDLAALPLIDFYRHIGCDIMPFGNYALAEDELFVPPALAVNPEVECEQRNGPDGLVLSTRKTPWGNLVASFKNKHPVKYPVTSAEDFAVFKKILLNTRYKEVEGSEASYRRLESRLGDDGLYIQTLQPSPVQTLLEYEMGMEGFYVLYQEQPGEMEEILEIMNHLHRQEDEITARRSPSESVILVENTSTTFISPSYYRRYSLPHLREFAGIMRAAGKVPILHMCGKLKDLLVSIRETGVDGIHALNEAPVGDTPWELALDVVGEDLIIIGMLDVTVFSNPSASAEEIHRCLDRMITPRIRGSHFILCAAGDGIPLPIEHFYAVRDWVEEKGKL